MIGKRLLETGLTPPEATRASRAVAAAWSRPCVRPGSTRSLPVVHSVMASPRACFSSAPLRDMGGHKPLNGATENASRVGRGTDASARTRVIWVFAGETKDTWHGRASELPAASRQLGRCWDGKDGAGDSADGERGDGFAMEDEATDRMRGSEEVVPCLSTAVGTDRTRDVLKDSGAADWAGPGVFFPALGRGREVSSKANQDNERGSCGLLGGGFSGGCDTHLKARRGYRGR